jgi:acyl-coenzyme A synthetase/AMP-(fatty) acid ligase
MNSFPLLRLGSLDDIFAWSPAGSIRVRDFLADVEALAAQLPVARFVLNVCQDRYRFAVGFAAGLLTGKTSLQPSSQSSETLRRIQHDFPDVVCLCDSEFDGVDLPRFDFPALAAAQPARVTGIPEIPADQIAACLFTSGSTGAPMPHFKTWGRLVLNGSAQAGRLSLREHPHAIVGTVPVQHSFGFESTFLLALQSQCSFWSGKPFYPQDIVTALKSVPRPRLLVTTPFHLSALLASGLELPTVDLLLSATAPLSMKLASDAETRFGAPLHEIFGSTETGQIASRRTTASQVWQLLPDIQLEQDGGQTFASGGHVEGRVVLSDIIEILADRLFLLHGRCTDQVNVAGKRSSLAYLNHQITAIPGVVDAAFFLPEETVQDGITRLCAFVVAPELKPQTLLAKLRERLDPVFLPRPLVFLDQLPRNSAGKLPISSLQALYAEQVEHARR